MHTDKEESDIEGTLPPEIIDRIFDNLDYNSLYETIKVCKRWNALGRRKIYYKAIERLCAPTSLIKEISDYAIIAGGSIVYALCDFVPIETVGDIDIFVLNSDIKMLKKLMDLVLVYYSNKKFRFSRHGDSVITIHVKNLPNSEPFIRYQFIFTSYQNPRDVIEKFDHDYVQCGLFNRELYITDRAIQAHKTRRILYFSGFLSKERLYKAVSKGFDLPIGFRIYPVNRVPLHDYRLTPEDCTRNIKTLLISSRITNRYDTLATYNPAVIADYDTIRLTLTQWRNIEHFSIVNRSEKVTRNIFSIGRYYVEVQSPLLVNGEKKWEEFGHRQFMCWIKFVKEEVCQWGYRTRGYDGIPTKLYGKYKAKWLDKLENFMEDRKNNSSNDEKRDKYLCMYPTIDFDNDTVSFSGWNLCVLSMKIVNNIPYKDDKTLRMMYHRYELLEKFSCSIRFFIEDILITSRKECPPSHHCPQKLSLTVDGEKEFEWNEFEEENKKNLNRYLIEKCEKN